MALRVVTKFPSTIVIDGEVIPIKIKRLLPEESVDFNAEFAWIANGKASVNGKASDNGSEQDREAEYRAKRFVVKSITEYVQVEPEHLFCDDDIESVTQGADLARLFGSRDEVLSELLLLIFMENRLSYEQKANWRMRLAPFVVTPDRVAARMMELAKVQEGDLVYDLGCGDGRLCIAAAKRGAMTYGWDIDSDRIAEATEAARAAGVLDRCTFMHGDALSVDLAPATVVSLYLLAGANAKLRPILLKALRPNARVVSHAFPIGGDWPADAVELVPLDEGEELVHAGQRQIYLYSVDRWRRAHPQS